jgi:uncharacterized protein with GYD domain
MALIAVRRIICDGPSRETTSKVAMKYVLLGNLSPEYASKQSERVGKAKAKLDKLGIKIESIHYTQGYYDFVDIVDAPNPEVMVAFSVWYSSQRLGSRLMSGVGLKAAVNTKYLSWSAPPPNELT